MDTAIKKQVLRQFTYGLYVVTCVENDVVNAFTANWLSQVSFEPLLLVLSVENNSKSLSMIQNSRKFVINVLRTGQRDLAGALGKSAVKYPDKLANIPYTLNDAGYPILRDALSWVACEVQQTMPAGDSTVFLASVVDVGTLGEGQPLTMNEAGFKHAG
jgi:flavin reductase (DIM6/NTAB) family NADH-FMN oxidoreductase RutF